MNRAVTVTLLLATLLIERANAQVTVYRDSYGLPSVEASRLADALYGLGYAMASDNAESMARNYKQARGRLAEVDGSSMLLEDSFIQSLGMEAEAEKKASALSGEAGQLTRSFCGGANRALADQKGTLPPWIQPFTPTDVLALAQLINCAFPLEDIARKLLPGTGSNQFAVAAHRSADGHALLSADPHLPWSGPLLWYEFSLYSHDIKFHGVTLNGLPFGVMGHTDKIAWCMTNNNPQLWGLFTVKTSSDHPGKYNYQGEWKSFENVTLNLKYIENGVMKNHEQPVRKTIWGPMVPFRNQAVKLSPVGCWDQIEEALDLARAQDAARFRAALKPRGIAMWNIAYADTAGDIGYQYNARVPVRDSQFDWTRPVDGADPRTEWGGLWSLDDLPHIENPHSDVLVNANSTPWATPLDDEIKSQNWPPYVTSYGSTTRFERLAVLLSTDRKVSVANAMRYATDTQVPYANKAVAALPRTIIGADSSKYREAASSLRGWTARADIGETGCTLYLYWLLADKRMPALARKAAAGTRWTAEEAASAVAALLSASAVMYRQYGRIDVSWGDVHVARRGDKIVPVSGYGYITAGDTVAAVTPNYGALKNGRIECEGGSSFRMIVDLDPKGVRSWSVLPYGESQNRASAHYSDQMDLFGRGEYKDTLFGLKRIRNQAVSKQILSTK